MWIFYLENLNKTTMHDNIQARSCNNCCSGKVIILTYFNSVCFVALGIQHAMLMCHTFIRGLSEPAIYFFPYYLKNDTTFE